MNRERTNYLSLSHQISERRRGLDLTQAEFGKRTGLGIQFIQEIEKGKKMPNR